MEQKNGIEFKLPLPVSQFSFPLKPMVFRIIFLLLVFTTTRFLAGAQHVKPAPAGTEKNQTKPAPNLIFEKKKMLIGILEKQESDWNKGNLNGFISAYWDSDTLRSVTVRGIQYGKDRLQRYLANNFPDSASMGHLNYDVVHIELIGENDALLTGKWLRKNDKKFRGGYFTILIRKLNSKWLIVAEHFG
jgi:hypothetical protein